MIFEQYLLDKAYNFEQYKDLVAQLLKDNKTTGLDQSESMIEYTKLNVVRLKRGEKQARLNDDQKAILAKAKPQYWLVITEAWCGDAAANLGIIHEMASSSDSIELKIILRDENPEIIDAFLTNGGRSVPKLILIDKETRSDFANWGPRPTILQDWLKKNKETGELSKAELTEAFQKWYAKDRGQTTAQEILSLVFL